MCRFCERLHIHTHRLHFQCVCANSANAVEMTIRSKIKLHKIVTVIFQRAMESHKFYKGDNVSNAEGVRFLANSTLEKGQDQSDSCSTPKVPVTQRIADALKKFRSPQAKKAFFVSFSLLILTGPSWVFPAFVADIFNRTGSTFSEKNSSLAISVTTLITNLVFLNFVERFNRKVMVLTSSYL